MADPLTSLRESLLGAAQPVTLSARFIEVGGATPPANLDAALRAAYRLGAVAGLEAWFQPQDVGPIEGRAFSIEHAQLSFLGYERAKSDVTLRFRQGERTVEIAIEVVLKDWSWPITFPAMVGWPFSVLVYATPTFLFTTERTTWRWRGGDTVTVSPGQSFIGTLTIPEELTKILELVEVPAPPSCTIVGPVQLEHVLIADADAAAAIESGPAATGDLPEPHVDATGSEEPSLMYPGLDLRAELPEAPVSVFAVKASAPVLGLLIGTSAEALGEGVAAYEQTPSLYFAAGLKITDELTLELRARALGGGELVGFALMVDPTSRIWLSPAAAVELIAGASGGGSFLDGVPGPLQQFLANVGLAGIALTGTLPPHRSLSSVGMTIANKPGTELKLFSDPSNGQAFAIQSFVVNWTIISPFEPSLLQHYVRITTSFHLWPKLFDKALFSISIDQAMRIEGIMEGTVSFRKLLSEISNNTIALPAGIDASLSDIALQIDPIAHSYALATTLDAAFSFVKFQGRPLIQIEDMRLTLSANTPNAGGATAYAGGFAGIIAVGPLSAGIEAHYDGVSTSPAWSLHAQLEEPLDIGKLVAQFFQPTGDPYEFPSFLKSELTIDEFSLDATVPTGEPASYEVAGALTWLVPLAELPLRAQAGLQYDPSRGAGAEFSGSIIGTLTIPALGTEVEVGYRFGPAEQDRIDLGLAHARRALPAASGDSSTLWVAWEGIRGEYEPKSQELELSLSDWSVGKLIQALVRTIGDPYFELESPWDFLNQISLDGLSLTIDFKAGATPRFYAEYSLSRPVELGFLTIKGVYLRRGEDDRVTLALDGSTTIDSLEGPLFNTKEGQSVQELPSVPGQGSAYFDLLLLALGQRVAIRSATLDSTKAVIESLEQAPPTTGQTNPVNPSGHEPLEPYYDPTAGWLFAAHFGILKVGKGYTFDCMVVFNDPDLYGLRLACSGQKAKVLDGLVLDVLYKKVSDDVGVYEIEFTFPKALRTIDLGSVTVTLPTIALQIYTNGDFLFDFGFPYNLDFSRSFCLQAIIPPGIPVLGAAGFYFGRLSLGAAAELPQSTPERQLIGSFSSAIAFGLGMQFGVGRYFQKGPLSAGFSITVFGIIEGLIAPWHAPHEKSEALVQTTGAGTLQEDYFFRLKGTFGLIGKLYGSVDFAIIKAEINLEVTLSASIAYESYSDILLSASASVSISVSVRIDLGLFSIKISFSFSTTISTDLTIQIADHNPPWYPPAALGGARTQMSSAALPRPAAPPCPKTLVRTAKPTLHLYPTPQFTVLAPEGATVASEQGAFVFLLATDAPNAERSGNRVGSSFDFLCEGLFVWVIDALANDSGAQVEFAQVAASSVSKGELEDFVTRLAKAPIAESEIESKFLWPGFEVVLEPPSATGQSGLQEGATIFPAFTGLTLVVPNPSGSGPDVPIALRDYVKVTPSYREKLTELFGELAARVEQESGGQGEPAARAAREEAGEPLAQLLFEDWFALVASQLLQAGADAIGDYAYERSGDAIADIVKWAGEAGNAVTPEDVAAPNLEQPLTAGKQLQIGGLAYTVQRRDSLAQIAARYTDTGSPRRWSLTPSELVEANVELEGLLATGVEVGFGDQLRTTTAGETFASLARELHTTPAQLAADAAFCARTDLLAPAAVADIPTFPYETAAQTPDTLEGVLTRFGLSLQAFLAQAANVQLGELFAAGPLRIAKLERLRVSDVWTALRATDQVAQIAGMVARFQLHGLRLPNEQGLILPADFLYPSGQQEWGLYQLSGQQFPTPPLSASPSYSISLAKDATLEELKLQATSVQLSEQARQLYYLLSYAQENVFDPQPTLSAQSAISAEARRYALQTHTPWSSSDQARLEAVTAPPSGAAAPGEAGQSPPGSAIVWDLPIGLLRRLEQRRSALARFPASLAEGYLPVVQPQLASSDPASGHTAYRTLKRFALATRIQFEVRRLAQTDDLAPPRPDANGVIPPGPGNSGAPSTLAPFSYELVGPRPADALLLERLLTAMDGLGTQIISQLFLLYPTAGPGSAGLTSRAEDEYLSFITQTNLSTETKPPTAVEHARLTGEPPRGIANEPAEFVKLLWELATVRTGGYYLYYQLPAEGSGLPDALFDASGVATLTLMVAYTRTDEAGVDTARIGDCTNALITTEAIDPTRSAMTLRSVSAPTRSQPLAGAQTLAELSELYGADVGVLARINREVRFAGGSQIPLAGIVHQLNAADIASGDPLAHVATYYSSGSLGPITRAQLAAFNPGVTAQLGAALRIPPFTCLASAPPSAPGDTFGELSAYYGLSYDALGHAAARVIGLFAATDVLGVDSQERDTYPSLGNGNAGVQLTRPPLSDPCPETVPPAQPAPPCPPLQPAAHEVDEFASAYMQMLYTMLSTAIGENPFFSASPNGLPSGPHKSLTPEEAFARRECSARRLALAAGAAESLDYAPALGFAAFCKANAAPQGEAQGPLPSRSANPYTGVGVPIQLHLRWLDLFGNQIVSAFERPPSGYAGPLNDMPMPIGYSDRIVGLGQWPNVYAHHAYAGQAGAPELTVTLQLRGEVYEASHEGWQQIARNDLQTWTRIYFQLNQDYDTLSTPGLSGQAISIALLNTLLEAPEMPLPEADAQAVREFVSQCLTYVWHRAHEEGTGEAPQLTLSLPIAIEELASADVIPMSLSLKLERQADLCDPALRAIPGALSDTTEILPLTGKEPDQPNVSLEQFASSAEAALQTSDWQLRVGTSSANPGEGEGSALWCVRMAKTPGSGLGFQVRPGASFYAPKPLATELRAGPATIGRYGTGKSFPDGSDTLTFAGVDLNAWANQALAAIDAFLAATYASPAFIVDQLLVSDPETNGHLRKILDHKQTLADAIAHTVKPILQSSADDQQSLAAAEEKLRQTLLGELSSAFTVTAVTVFSVTDARARKPLAPDAAAPPRFYGQPLGTPADAHASTTESNFTLSSAKVPLTRSSENGDSRLAFLFSSKNVAARAYVPLTLEYALSHLEHEIVEVPGIVGYQQSQWIKFVNGPFKRPLPGSDSIPDSVDLPVVLRALPQPPSLTAQTATATHHNTKGEPVVPPAATPGQLAEWDYAFSYLYAAAAQDEVSLRVEFNHGPTLTGTPDPAAALFEALAQFTTVHPAIAADLEIYLRPIDANATASDQTVLNAGAALAALEQITATLAKAYEQWSRWEAPQTETVGGGPIPVVYEFEVALADAEGRARVEIYAQDKSLPRPLVEVDASRYEAIAVEQPAPALYAYEYRDKQSSGEEKWLGYEGARELPARAVSFAGNDAFAHQDGYVSIKVQRNVRLSPSEPTRKTFQFSTPEITPADRIVPSLVYSAYDLDALAEAGSPLESYLESFFTSLLSHAGERTVAVKLASGYTFRLAPGVETLAATVLPIHLLAPTLAPSAQDPSPLVLAVASAVQEWLQANPRPRRDTTQLTFALEVLAAGDGAEQKPLLAIRDLHVALRGAS